MPQSNTYTDIQAFVNTVFQDALAYAREQNLMTGLVRVFDDRQGMAPRTFSEYGTATINPIGEMDDLASQAFYPTVLSTLTPSEAGGQFFITDQRIETDPFGVREDAAMELGQAMAESFERALISDFPNLTGGTVGTAGTAFSWSFFYAMLTQLRNQKAPLPYSLVLHPNQYHVIGTAVTPAGGAQTNAPNFQDDVVRRFWVQSIGPVDVFTTSNIPVDGSDDAVVALFSRNALAIDLRRRPRLEPERDASRRGWELNMTAIYGHGAIRPKWGVKGTFDASLPAGS